MQICLICFLHKKNSYFLYMYIIYITSILLQLPRREIYLRTFLHILVLSLWLSTRSGLLERYSSMALYTLCNKLLYIDYYLRQKSPSIEHDAMYN